MNTSTENQLRERWYHLHVSGGGSLSWDQIAEQENCGLNGNTIRKRVKVWKEAQQLNGAPPEMGVPSTLPSEVEVLDPHKLPPDWMERMWNNTKEQARLRQETKKAQTVFRVRIPDNLPVMHTWTADWHLFDSGTDHDLFDEDLSLWATTPGVYLGIGGGLSNWTSPAVLPRAMPANVLPSDYAAMLLRYKMEQIRRQVLYGVEGNHDDFPSATGWHPVADIYRECGIPNLGPGGRVFLTVGAVTYQIEARHSFNFNSALNDTNSHRQLWAQAGKPDMVFTAHLHHPTMHHRTFDGDDTVWARNGSYKREDHYAKSKNFVHTQSEPADQPAVILMPDSKRMIPFRNYRDGLPLLAALREQYAKRTA